MSDTAQYLEVSPAVADGGNLIGKTPRQVGLPALRELGHREQPLKAIRAKCLDCVGSTLEIRKCVQFDCPLWPMRMGKNPFHGR